MFLHFFKKKKNTGTNAELERMVREKGIDPAMYYCPSCNSEFRLAVSLCPGCQITLISGVEKLACLEREQERFLNRSMEILPGEELVTVRKGTLGEMKYLQNVLEKDHVPAMITEEENSCGKGCCGPELCLNIRRDDVALALEILAKDFVRSTALDSHDLCNASAVFDPTAAETHCPACGCRFSPSVGACPDCGLSLE